MIKDGLIRPVADTHGWLPIEDAPLATRSDGTAEPMRVEGLTTHGRFVDAWYYAAGDYQDRWCDVTGSIVYRLTHFRAARS